MAAVPLILTSSDEVAFSKAWINATTSATINRDFNFSSGTDHGTGDYSYSFDTAFSNVNDYDWNCYCDETNVQYFAHSRNSLRDDTTRAATYTNNNNVDTRIDRATWGNCVGDLA